MFICIWVFYPKTVRERRENGRGTIRKKLVTMRERLETEREHNVNERITVTVIIIVLSL